MIGRLNTKITKLDAIRVADGLGGHAITWQPAGEIWAEIIWRRSRADTAGLRTSRRRRNRLRIRTDDSITFDTRLDINGTHYAIRSIIPAADRQPFLVLETEEIS
ncbi:MAG: head-tail adaptor protein [Aquisalinus sp.]|nr:head-tail adaptor protein [Aquisalinus sp.]